LLPIHSGWSKPVVKYSVAGLAGYPEAINGAEQALMLWTDYNTRNNSKIVFQPARTGEAIDLTFLIAPPGSPLTGPGSPDHAAGLALSFPVSLTDNRIKSATIHIDIANVGTPPTRACPSAP
jgi:hypothetical protein